MGPDVTLEVAGLRKRYDGFGFGPVDLTVGREVVAVLGPSGSGKTTLLSTVAGIVNPDGGSVVLGGRKLTDRPLEDRRVGLVFQEGALFPHMSARENIEYAAVEDGRVEEFAAALELGDVLDRRPPSLSGGERQRVALARTLAADPDALLLDEPLSSLDAPIRRRLREELHDLFESLEIPVLYVTHDQRTAMALGDRVAIVRDGTIEQIGRPATVLDRPTSRFVARFTGNENLLRGRVTGRTERGVCVRTEGIELRSDRSVEPGTPVVACIHPSRVELAPIEASVGTEAGRETAGANTLAGTVVRQLNEGTGHRIDLDVADGSVTLTASVRPPTIERLGVEPGVELRAILPREAIHLIPEPSGG